MKNQNQQSKEAKIKCEHAFRKRMRKYWSEDKINQYLQYCDTEESFAVLFVKKYLPRAQYMWIDILRCLSPEPFDCTELQFRRVRFDLFPRKIHPKYPPRENYPAGEFGDALHLRVCRALTWETAQEDIAKQRRKGVKGQPYSITMTAKPQKEGGYRFTVHIQKL